MSNVSKDHRGDGSGGTSIYGLIDAQVTRLKDVTLSQRRFIKSLSHLEIREKGRVVASEMQRVRDTIGSQFLITVDSGPGCQKFWRRKKRNLLAHFYHMGELVEDENDVLGKNNEAYCDRDGRPYANIPIVRMFISEDPFEDPSDMDEFLRRKGINLFKENDFEENDKVCARWLSCVSPTYDRSPGETVEVRIRADQIN